MFETVVTIYGEGKQTNEAADALTKAGVRNRVSLSRDHPGIVVLSLPFGEIYGLDQIRKFAERAANSTLAEI